VRTYEYPFLSRCYRYKKIVSTTPVANLPPVALIPVVHLDLRISPQIAKKFKMTPILFSGAWWKMIHEKNL
jgi:hypothetical protein